MICSQDYPLLNISLPPHSSTKNILSSRDWGPPSENCCDYILVAHKILHIYNQETGICTLVHISLTESISSFLFPFFSILFSHKDKRGGDSMRLRVFCVCAPVCRSRAEEQQQPAVPGTDTHIHIASPGFPALESLLCRKKEEKSGPERERERVYCRLEVLFVASVHRATLCSLDGSPDISSSRQAV